MDIGAEGGRSEGRIKGKREVQKQREKKGERVEEEHSRLQGIVVGFSEEKKKRGAATFKRP